MHEFQERLRQAGFERARTGRVFGGVVAGLGRRMGIDPWPARALFVIALMLLPGSQLLVYPLLWILLPQEPEIESAEPAMTSAGATAS